MRNALLLFTLLFFTFFSNAQRVNEGFGGTFPASGWTLTNASSVVTQDLTINAYGSATNVGCVVGDYYNVSSGFATLETPAFTATTVNDSLRFDISYAGYGSPYIDSFAVLAYVGSSYVYLREWLGAFVVDTGITTVASTSSQFTPSASQWRTKVIGLPVGTTKVEFKFMTGYGNEMYVDNVVVDSYFVATQTFDSLSTAKSFSYLITQGGKNQVVLKIPVKVTGQISPMSVTNFNFDTYLTTTPLTTLDSARVYYTGSNTNFSTVSKFGGVASPSGSFTVNGSQVLANGFNYFWLVYDIKSSATLASTVDASLTYATIGGVFRAPNISSPTGSFQVAKPYYFDGATDQNFTTAVLSGTASQEWQRGIPTAGPSSALTTPNCWGTNLSGNYSPDANYALSSPIYIATATAIPCSYSEWFDINSGWDYGYFEYKINSGTWTSLGLSVSGSNTAWNTKMNTLTTAINDTVQFRWRFSSVAWFVPTTHTGWYIDNFAILNANEIDLTPPTISYVPVANTATFSNRVLSNFATISDVSFIDSSATFKPRIYFKKKSENNAFGANNSSFNGWKYAQSSNLSSPFSYTINYSLLTLPPIVGDTIQYFVVAQDLAPAHNTGSNPSTGFYATDVTNITSIPTSPNSYIFTSSPLSGSFNVGSGQVYTTLTQVVNDLNLRGVNGAVTLLLTDNNYSTSETFPLTIGNIGNASSTNNVTIKPTLTPTTITGNATSIFNFNGTKFFKIDGSVTTNTRDLTIANTNTGTASTILISSGGIGLGATNDTIKNCIIQGSGNYNNLGVNIGNGTFTASGSPSITSNVTSSPDNTNIAFINNQICKVKVGLGLTGTSTNKASNILISNNLFGSAVATDYLLWGAVMIANATNVNFTQNTIQNIVSSNTDQKAIYGGTGFANSSITKNVIDSMFYTGSGGWGVMGIHLQNASNITLTNNMVSRLWADGWYPASSTDATVGIKIDGGSGYNIYYNTVSLTGTYAAGYGASTICAAFYASPSSTLMNLKNNIFSNSFVNGNASATSALSYAFYSDAPTTAYTTANFNNYYVSGTQGMLAYANSAAQATLALLKTATGKDVNSVNVLTNFTSNGDLHLTGGSIGDLNLGCAVTAGITTDIDNQTRNTGWHYMGADENTSSPLPVNLLYFNAAKSGNDALLNWATGSEINNSHFIVERSLNGTDFTSIGKVAGAGNSSRVNQYSFTDFNADKVSNEGLVFYRFIQVDLDGKMAQSKVVTVDFSSHKNISVSASPNPFTSSIQLTTAYNHTGKMNVLINDLQGKNIYQNTIEISKGNHLVDINDLPEMKSGIYFLKTVFDEETTVIKLIKTAE